MTLLAFYVGQGNFSDRVIRWVTRSRLSHVELLGEPPKRGADGILRGRAWTSSKRDGGVRTKLIAFDPDHWVFVNVPWARPDALHVIAAELGKPYDLLGVVASLFISLRRHRPDRWFCSELCAHAIGMSAPEELTPGSLYRRVIEMNRVNALGVLVAGNPPEDRPLVGCDSASKSFD